MAKLQLSFASALYDRMQPIFSGEVPVDGIDLNFIRIEQPRPIFDRMSGGQEFDVAEYSSSEFVQRFANKQCPFVAIPVFPSRCFRHGFIAINKKSGIKTPKDLEGKRVGVPLYTMTAAIFIRGLLQHEYGVDLSKIRWVQGAVNHAGSHGDPHVLPLLKPVPIEQAPRGRSLSDLIEEGFVSRVAGAKTYELGQEARVMAISARRTVDIAELAQPSLLRLSERSADTALLSVRSGVEALYLARSVGSHPLQPNYLQIGSRRPLGVGAGSLALMVWLPAGRVEVLRLARPFTSAAEPK
jgi:hypothetical protein